MTEQPKLRLAYFGFGGRARAVRLALRLSKIEFEDYKFTFEQWGSNLKSVCPFGTCPVLEIGVTTGVAFPDPNATVLATSNGILLYVGSLGGLLPSCPVERGQVGDVLDWVENFVSLLSPSIREQDAEKRLAMRAELAAERVPSFLRQLESIASKSTDGFLVGKKLSIADLKAEGIIRSLLTGQFDGLNASLLENCPNLKKFNAVVSAIVDPLNEA